MMTNDTNNPPLSVKLRNGLRVLAKTWKGAPSAYTFANLKQAYAKAALYPGAWVTAGRPFYVVLPNDNSAT